MVHVPRSEITIPCLLVAFFPRENEGVKPHVLSVVHSFGFICLSVQLVYSFEGEEDGYLFLVAPLPFNGSLSQITF